MNTKLIVNRHRNVALMYDQTDSHIKVIPMQVGELTTGKLTEEELTGDWSELIGYDPRKAARSFLAHPGGVSDKVKLILEGLLFEHYEDGKANGNPQTEKGNAT